MSKKLLLADDSVTIQKVVNLTFADEGIEVITAGDGNAAMRMLYETAPDLVMADVNMPGLSGYQLCEQIKQNEDTKNTPVILLVGSFEPFDEAEAKRVGADDFLTKPFQSIRQLVNKVTTLLESAANGQTVAARAVGSLADTQEFEQPATQTAVPYGDAAMDDEMIQSNSTAGLAFDETQKFSTGDYEIRTEDDFAKTQPYSVEDYRDIIEPTESFSTAEVVTESPIQPYEFREEGKPKLSESEIEVQMLHEFEEETLMDFETSPAEETSGEFKEKSIETAAEAREEEIPQPKTASLLELDDDFLELPPLFDEEEAEPAPSQEAPAVQETMPETTVAETVAETPIVPTETPAVVEQKTLQAFEMRETAVHLPPDMIDAIARRVIEKLADQAIREIAWEVVPQQAELIIKKMVEEKLKE